MINKTFIILLSLILFSCGKSGSKIDNQFDKEFTDSININHYKPFKVQIAPDWEAIGYFKGSDLRTFYYVTKPEIGFISNRVYISNHKGIEKIIYRSCLPKFSKKAGDYKLVDSIFEIYPDKNEIIRFFNNQVIDTIRNVHRTEKILKEINFYKMQIEKQNNGI